jgi:DNA-binding NarL/FixJ family response regulator
MTIGVLVVDDERLIRDGFRRLLDLVPDLTVVAEAANGTEALELIEKFRPIVVLLDVRMPGLDGLGVLDALKQRATRPAILVLTTFDDSRLLLEAARRGAQGFLSKDVSLDELAAAIRALAAGGNWFQPTLTASLRRAVAYRRNGAAAPIGEHLTSREVEVLRLMAGGLSNREIASALQTAEGTVKNQVSSILSKIGVQDRMLAVLEAIEAGWI